MSGRPKRSTSDPVEDLRAATREAHEVLKDLRQVIKEAKEVAHEVRVAAAIGAEEQIEPVILADLEAWKEHVTRTTLELDAKVAERFDRLWGWVINDGDLDVSVIKAALQTEYAPMIANSVLMAASEEVLAALGTTDQSLSVVSVDPSRKEVPSWRPE